MKLIFCVDKKKGMMFLGKRQSQDRNLREKIVEIAGEEKLWMSGYSAKQFEDFDRIIVDDDYADKAKENDYCFVENLGYALEPTNEIILCHWNRQYPADKFLDIDLQANGFQKVSTENIVGSSHEKITIERYQRR